MTTADGRGIEVAANVGSIAELDPAAARGADGVGLFRTEFLFLDRGDPPTEDEQYEAVTEAPACSSSESRTPRRPRNGLDSAGRSR